MITTRQWLASVPETLNLYAILGNVSDAKPVAAYFEKTHQINLTALWQDTPYANWFEAMPYIVPIERHSPFLNWVDNASSEDWGWIAASPFDTETIQLHFKSLTKVMMPDGTEVFFRYWDGRHLYPILSYLQAKAGEVIPVFSHYLINQQTIQVAITHNSPEVKDFPWWKIEPQLIARLIKNNPMNVASQLVNLLKQNDPELSLIYPEKNLLIKAQRFVEDDIFNIETAYNDFRRLISGRY